MLARRPRIRLEGALRLLRLRGLLLPVAVEQVVHHRDRLGDALLVELAREQSGNVLDHAPPLRLVNRLRGRSYEQQPGLLLAVVVVERHVDLDRLVAKRAEVLESALERAMEAAPDLSGPADQQHQLLVVKAQAGLFGLGALRVDERLGVQIVEPGRQRLFDLLLRHAFEDRDVSVDVYFHPHGGFPGERGVQFITHMSIFDHRRLSTDPS